MIKRLRFYFIFISLISVLFVLSMTMGAINIYNYTKVASEGDITLRQVIDETNRKEEHNPPHFPEDNKGHEPGMDRLNIDNYFIVLFNNEGAVINCNFNHIFSIDEEDGLKLANDVYLASKSKGNINNLRYKKENRNNVTYVAFVDLKRQLETASIFLSTSLIVSSISYLLLGGLIVLASFIIFKPSETAYQKQKKFITNASHELKTPLTIISTDLEIIEMDHGENEWTSSIKDQVNRLTIMTNQLVTLSRLDENDLKNYPFETFSLSDLTNECLDSFLPSFKKQGLSLEGHIAKDIVYHGNKYLIDELLYILLDNALKYTVDQGKASILLENNKKDMKIVVSNEIEEDHQIDTKQLFDRFYRSPNAKKSGSGIGLSIAQEIVKIHKGQIKAHIDKNIISFEISL